MTRIFILAMVALYFAISLTKQASASDAMAEAYRDQASRSIKSGALHTAIRLLENAKSELEMVNGGYVNKRNAALVFGDLGKTYREMAKLPAFKNQKIELLESSEKALHQALLFKEDAYGPNALEIANPLEELGNTYYDSDKNPEAEAMFRKALLVREQNQGRDCCESYADLWWLGKLLSYGTVSSKKESSDFFKRALAVATQCRGPIDVSVGRIHNEMALFAYKDGHLEAAGVHYDRAVAIFAANGAATKTELNSCKVNLRCIPVDCYALAWQNFRRLRPAGSQKPLGPELVPAIDKLIVASARLNKKVDVNYLKGLKVMLASKKTR